jgi:hypothetical protein
MEEDTALRKKGNAIVYSTLSREVLINVVGSEEVVMQKE